jgi:hypothetical protein
LYNVDSVQCNCSAKYTLAAFGIWRVTGIIGSSTQVIIEIIQEMEELTNDIGLKINVDKTKYMNTSKYRQKYAT